MLRSSFFCFWSFIFLKHPVCTPNFLICYIFRVYSHEARLRLRTPQIGNAPDIINVLTPFYYLFDWHLLVFYSYFWQDTCLRIFRILLAVLFGTGWRHIYVNSARFQRIINIAGLFYDVPLNFFGLISPKSNLFFNFPCKQVVCPGPKGRCHARGAGLVQITTNHGC